MFLGSRKISTRNPGCNRCCLWICWCITLNPKYSDVCAGGTGHAEVVNVEFDSSTISFESLLKEFVDKYGSRIASNLSSSSQYRSVVFYRNIEQKEGIEKVFNEYRQKGGKAITTQVLPFTQFYEAEKYHQDYYGSCRKSA